MGAMLASSGGRGATAAAAGMGEFEAGITMTDAPGAVAGGETVGTFGSGMVSKTPVTPGVAAAGGGDVGSIDASGRGRCDCQYQ